MKLRPTQNSTRPQIFEHYEHPWYEFNDNEKKDAKLIRPKPPSSEAVKKAQFVDKTYEWKPNNRTT